MTVASDRPINVLITGGAGFVMSNVVRHLLTTIPRATAVILDLTPVDGLVADFLAPVEERVVAVQGDIRDRAILEEIGGERPITHIVHGAMIAHLPEWEKASPDRYVDVNVMGTVRLLEFAREHGHMQRFIYVSSGDVYGEPSAGSSREPHRVTGTHNQPELYAISKYASEQIVRRYGELFGLETVRLRFSGVFGPMERPTPGRAKMAIPYHMMRAAIERRPLQLSEQTLAAGGDYISAEDIAFAFPPLLQKVLPQPHDVFNVAHGEYTPIRTLLDEFARVAPTFRYELVPEERADISKDPGQRLARWNAYAIGRLTAAVGWQPRPIGEQLRSYYEWVMEEPEARCPRLPERAMLQVQ